MGSIKSYNEYRQIWNDAKKGIIYDVPIHLDIELSSVCNLQCVMCPQNKLSYSEKQFMPIKLFKDIIDEAHEIGVLSVKLNWRGEATLHSEFNTALKYCKNKFVDVMLNTNGMYNIYFNNVIAENIDTVIFSLDSLKADILKRIRHGANKDRILLNIKTLQDYKQEKIRLNFTRQKLNWNEYNAIKYFCEKNDIIFCPSVMFPRVTDDKFIMKKVKITGRKFCSYPYQRLTIACNGQVYPCCVAWDGSGTIGYINEGLLNLWHGKIMSDIRYQAERKEYKNKICQECTSWNSYNTERII